MKPTKLTDFTEDFTDFTDLPRDIDYKILNLLSDKDLNNFCRINKFKSICEDDMFWKSRILAIFGSNSKEVLKNKPKSQTYKEFYESENLQQLIKIRGWCLDLLNLPKKSQMVIDDFYNPQTGFIKVLGNEDMIYLLLKIVLQRYRKEGLDDTKLIQLVKQAKNEIPKYDPFAGKFSDSLDLTENEKKVFYKLLNVPVDRRQILQRNSKLLKGDAELAKFISFINIGFKEGKLPLDIKWDELCTHPYLYTEKLVF